MNVLVTPMGFDDRLLARIFREQDRPLGIYKMPRVIFNPHNRRLNEQELLEFVAKFQPVGMIAGLERMGRSILERTGSLKVISRSGVDVDNIDQEATSELGIRLYSTPEAPVVSVAELTVSLILALLRRVNAADAGIRSGRWEIPEGGLLAGRTVGIVGCGRIGTQVASRLKAFGCRLIGSDPVVSQHHEIEMVGFNALLKQADIITMHISYSEESHHLFGERQFRKMKPDALLINTARGGLVDEGALVRALRADDIGGAAIDCFEQEPYLGPLTEMPDRTILTAHMGAGATESRKKIEEEAAQNLLRGLKETDSLI